MKNTIAVAVVIFAMAALALYNANLIGAAGEPMLLAAAGSLLILVASLLSSPTDPDAVVSTQHLAFA